MEKLSLDELIDQFKGMTLLELQAFTKRFEETFGVKATFYIQESAQVPVQSVRDKAPSEEEQFEFDVMLTATGPNRIAVIKELRLLKHLGLKEAKDLADSAPTTIFAGIPRDDAKTIQRVLTDVGAIIEIK